MKITDYEKVQSLAANHIFLIDGDSGTKAILASDLAKGLEKLMGFENLNLELDLSKLTQINSLAAGNKLLVGTTDGNVAIAAEDALFAVLDAFAAPEVHSRVFRGKNLGTFFTEEQKANIQNGTFKGLFLGDYWVIGGVNWRIWDFDYWYNAGDTAFTNHHVVIMPDTCLYEAKMNDSNITTGGYVGSKMYTANLANAKTQINAAFGSAVLTHRDLLVNAVTSGYPSAGSWYDSSVELPNEIMMYGSYVHTPAGNGSTAPYRYTINKKQLALAAIAPKYVNIRANYWLRDVVSSAYFALVGAHGNTASPAASDSSGVRPVFPVG